MGRKADPKGKDRTRTIQLAGDVADIAQKLADKGALSATLSELLRHNYGFGDKIDEKKRELEATHEQRVALQRREEDLAAAIDELEARFLEEQSAVRPALEKRRAILLERLKNTEKKLHYAFEHNEIARLHNVITNINMMVAEVDRELEFLE
tara:strand:+ start:1185 stop:1640 length:456 start_codon:yes stop_codon:yes gene_type:complete